MGYGLARVGFPTCGSRHPVGPSHFGMLVRSWPTFLPARHFNSQQPMSGRGRHTIPMCVFVGVCWGQCASALILYWLDSVVYCVRAGGVSTGGFSGACGQRSLAGPVVTGALLMSPINHSSGFPFEFTVVVLTATQTTSSAMMKPILNSHLDPYDSVTDH